MGTLNWSILTYARDENRNTAGTVDVASGTFSTSTTRAVVTGLLPRKGELVKLTASEAMWVRFGGRTVAVGTGIHFGAGEAYTHEVSENDDSLAVEAIDVS